MKCLVVHMLQVLEGHGDEVFGCPYAAGIGGLW